jgi:iron(III) transport system substrate-binding protein
MNKISILFLLISGIAAAATPPEVVVYTSVDDVFARPIAAEFERKTGIRVKLVTDTEETKSTGLLNRLILEKDRPQGDVFWSGDPVRSAVLKKKGVSATYLSPAAKGLPKLYSDRSGHWTGFSARARVLLVNTEKMKGHPRPTSVLDLADPRYKALGCMANPLFGTTSMHAAALFESLGQKKAERLFQSISANGTKILSSNGEVRRRVVSGDCGFGLTDTDDAYEAVRDKKPVAVVFPDSKGMGTLIVPNAATLIEGAPNSDNGRKFVDFLLSPETEKKLAESDAAQMPVRKGVVGPDYIQRLDSLKPMKVNYAKLADRLEDLSRGFLKNWVDQSLK